MNLYIKSTKQRVRVLKKSGAEWKCKYIGRDNIGWFHVSELTFL